MGRSRILTASGRCSANKFPKREEIPRPVKRRGDLFFVLLFVLTLLWRVVDAFAASSGALRESAQVRAFRSMSQIDLPPFPNGPGTTDSTSVYVPPRSSASAAPKPRRTRHRFRRKGLHGAARN